MSSNEPIPITPDAPHYSLEIPRLRFTMFSALLVVVLITNHLMLQSFHYQTGRGHWLILQLFDVDVEDSFPTWCSATLLLIAAVLLHVIATAKARVSDHYRYHWAILAGGFLLLSIDEVAGLHESLNTVIDFPWTKPAAIVVGVVGLFYIGFLAHLPRRTAAGFILAGGIFISGAVGVEHATDWYLEIYDMDSLGYNVLTGIEEGTEMLGIVLFIGQLLRYMEVGSRLSIPVVVRAE